MLSWLRIRAFRNLEPALVELDEGPALVSGANGEGKSSLLEAAYVLATTRSFRTREVREAIPFGAAELRVEGGVVDASGRISEVAVQVGRGRGNRRLTVGEYEAKLVDYLALLPALAMAGESVRNTAGSPAERRRYIDRATAAAQPAHLKGLSEYRRALAHRNRLLRRAAQDKELEPWDEILARSGEAVIARRTRQMAEWQREIGSWPDLFPEGESARLGYRRAGGESDAGLAERLARARGADRRIGATTVGPHRDDLDVSIDGRSLWRFGSAGQVRSAIAALTLAQARTVARARDRRPLLILDDIDTDLDPARCEALLDASAAEGQVVAATSKPAVGAGRDARRLAVSAGRLERAHDGTRGNAT